ncbi:putative WRKY transcription factor 75 [Glycine soja]
MEKHQVVSPISSSSSASPSDFKLGDHNSNAHIKNSKAKPERWQRNQAAQICISNKECSYRGCNVKKQIQRHSKDEEIVVTTYEGMHIHPVQKSTESFEHILRNDHIYSLTL